MSLWIVFQTHSNDSATHRLKVLKKKNKVLFKDVKLKKKTEENEDSNELHYNTFPLSPVTRITGRSIWKWFNDKTFVGLPHAASNQIKGLMFRRRPGTKTEMKPDKITATTQSGNFWNPNTSEACLIRFAFVCYRVPEGEGWGIIQWSGWRVLEVRQSLMEIRHLSCRLPCDNS